MVNNNVVVAILALVVEEGTWTEREFRSAARKGAGLGSRENIPVVVVEGADAPKVEGQSYYFTTPGGRPVYHPSAYRRAWGKPVYNPSTRRVVVGREWRPTV